MSSLGSRASGSTSLLVTFVAGLLLASFAGLDLVSPGATIIACLALLIFGVPHGSLDIEVLRNQHRYGARRIAAVLTLYVGIAALMYLLWQVAPIAALTTFLMTAVVHFSEDWDDVGSAFLAQGMSAALLTAPAFLHLNDMQSLFIALSGRQDAAVLGDIMLLLAPVGLAIAAIALLSYWQSGRSERAGAGIAVIAGMALLPPAVGFAAFFCLYHSPRHFRDALTHLSADQFRRRWQVIVPLTLAALSLAGWLFVQEARSGVLAQVVAASFMTLSVLTVPHMAVPFIVTYLFGERGPLTSILKDGPVADQGFPRVSAQG
jgi:Brp/Blh family beta-carotene 15,15'-monooxygenase